MVPAKTKHDLAKVDKIVLKHSIVNSNEMLIHLVTDQRVTEKIFGLNWIAFDHAIGTRQTNDNNKVMPNATLASLKMVFLCWVSIRL